MKKQILLSSLAVAALASPQAALATCAEFRVSAAELNLSYDPFNPAAVERTFTLRARRLNPAVTAVRILLADPGATFGAARLGRDSPASYDIRWNQDMGRIVFVSGAEQPNATNGALIAFEAGASSDVANETFRIRIPAGQAIAAGSYYQPLDVRYTCYSGRGEIDDALPQTGAQVAVDLRVPERIATFIGSAGTRRGRIDFGTLEPGSGAPVRSLVVTAQSTIPYDIRVDMDRGALKRSDKDDFALRYALKLSGFPIGDRARLSCERTPAPGGRNHPLQVELDAKDLGHAPAGAYSDVITLTFSPRLGLAGGEGCSPSGA